MITLNVRKQGGAAVITIPSDILKLLNIEIGDTLAMDISGKSLIIHALEEPKKRYSVSELLQGVTKNDIEALNDETNWFRDGKPTGREIV